MTDYEHHTISRVEAVLLRLVCPAVGLVAAIAMVIQRAVTVEGVGLVVALIGTRAATSSAARR